MLLCLLVLLLIMCFCVHCAWHMFVALLELKLHFVFELLRVQMRRSEDVWWDMYLPGMLLKTFFSISITSRLSNWYVVQAEDFVIIVHNKNSFSKEITKNNLNAWRNLSLKLKKKIFYIYSNPEFSELFTEELIFRTEGWHKNYNINLYKL